MSALIEMPDEIVALKARLNVEAARHLHSIEIVEAFTTERQREILLPGYDRIKNDVKKVIEDTQTARDEMNLRATQGMVRGPQPVESNDSV